MLRSKMLTRPSLLKSSGSPEPLCCQWLKKIDRSKILTTPSPLRSPVRVAARLVKRKWEPRVAKTMITRAAISRENVLLDERFGYDLGVKVITNYRLGSMYRSC